MQELTLESAQLRKQFAALIQQLAQSLADFMASPQKQQSVERDEQPWLETKRHATGALSSGPLVLSLALVAVDTE
eukprot:1111411-Amphidinium_carterae.1